MKLSIESNLISRPVIVAKTSPVKANIPQLLGSPPPNISNPVIASSPGPQVLSLNLFANPGLVEGSLQVQDTTEGTFEVQTPDEILDWTDDVPPIKVEFEEIPLEINKKVKSVDSDPDGADDEEKSSKQARNKKLETTEEKQEESF